jgi:hypothetical protein
MRGGGLTYTIQFIVKCTLGFPALAFFISVIWTLLIDFDPKSSTHCEVDEFLPSFSSVIGEGISQKYIWNIAIAFHAAPRFLLANLYRNLYVERLNIGAWTPKFITLNYYLNCVEALCLVGLSFISSTEYYPAHKACFIFFICTYGVSLSLTNYMIKFCGFEARCREETISYQWKKKILISTCLFIPLALYFFYRHNEYCEPHVYSFFGVFEYLIILGNMFYHGCAYLDFKDVVLTVGPAQILAR